MEAPGPPKDTEPTVSTISGLGERPAEDLDIEDSNTSGTKRSAAMAQLDEAESENSPRGSPTDASEQIPLTSDRLGPGHTARPSTSDGRSDVGSSGFNMELDEIVLSSPIHPPDKELEGSLGQSDEMNSHAATQAISEPPEPRSNGIRTETEDVDMLDNTNEEVTEEWETASFRSAVQDVNMDLYHDPTSVDSREEYNTNLREPSHIIERGSVPPHPGTCEDLDLANHIQGMYRLLDLVLEQGSGGLVDKIVIAQESLGRLIQDLRPGAYTSMTKIDFKELDEVTVKPVGVYGSKSEIVRFIESLGIASAVILELLSKPRNEKDDLTLPHLRAGLYFIRSDRADKYGNCNSFVIFWPEETTWDDDAISSVSRNRITFMRYLSKLVDQTIALISPEHSELLNWRSIDQGSLESDIDDDFGRMFSFEVAKTRDEDENVTATANFKIYDSNIKNPAPGPTGNYELLSPTLVPGPTHSAFLTSKFRPKAKKTKDLKGNYNGKQVEHLLSIPTTFPLSVDYEVLKYLMKHGLRKRFPNQCAQYDREMQEFEAFEEGQRSAESERRRSDMEQTKEKTIMLARERVKDCLLDLYPTIFASEVSDSKQVVEGETLSTARESSNEGRDDTDTRTTFIFESLHQAISSSSFASVSSKEYQSLKCRVVLAMHALDEQADADEASRLATVQDALWKDGDAALPLHDQDDPPISSHSDGDKSASSHKPSKKSRSALGGLWYHIWRSTPKLLFGGNWSTQETNAAVTTAAELSDPVFVAQFAELQEKYPALEHSFSRLRSMMDAWVAETVAVSAQSASVTVLKLLEENSLTETEHYSNFRRDNERRARCKRLMTAINSSNSSSETTRQNRLQDISLSKDKKHKSDLRITGSEVYYLEPCVEIKLHPVELTQADKHLLRDSSDYVPTPRIRQSHSFEIALHQRLRYVERIDEHRYLVAVDNDKGHYCDIFVEDISQLARAIAKETSKKKIHFSKFSETFKMAFDRSTRLLAVCGAAPGPICDLRLQIWLFDEHLSSTTTRGAPICLNTWYEGLPTIKSVLFVSGSEELCLIEQNGRARVFSLITEHFRPASVQLSEAVLLASSAPDGSCLMTTTASPDGFELVAYHWSSFGSKSDGIRLPVPFPVDTSFALTSLEKNGVYLLGLSPSKTSLESIRLHIQKKSSEFLFQESEVRSRPSDGFNTLHNSLLDCHVDVWTRFPVQAAIQREIIDPKSRRPAKLAYISTDPTAPFKEYMLLLIHAFRERAQKPGGSLFERWEIQSLARAEQFFSEAISEYSAGLWIVELLCLIPLHIAITHQNRFVPLKDGVLNHDYERELLGADVLDIVDALSIGWYESLFQSYMAAKPVRVVSSMGEQSVGKSYCLNHFADSSFAGSAMRTTEGVWMSVTPTRDALIVAMDFEGVHSIERSPQEDALLVLFNTAISNLVLFRNNFALSRDITGLFTSFQSSSSILDPQENPSLFNGVLAIVIRDVVDSDKKEIVKEFQHKFQRIVQEEQEDNFISRLHRGRLKIMPWPVINSPSFYTLFTRLKTEFERENITHINASIFLQTLKTLMAKLKVNDWGALDQNLATHRARTLELILPTALAWGLSEVNPGPEPLRNLDTDTIVSLEAKDSDCIFFVADPSSDTRSNDGRRDACFRDARSTCESILPDRISVDDSQWVLSLQDLLDRLVQGRTEYVAAWLDCNTSRFSENEATRSLKRAAEHAFLDLKGTVQLCTSECASCSLRCIERKHHAAEHSCRTSHICWRDCEITEDHVNAIGCGLPAGHSGRHMCDVSAHSCGAECSLQGKKGCLGRCSLPIDHRGGTHLCAARTHLCGQPCALQDVTVQQGVQFSCDGSCNLPWDEPHERHECDRAQLCPIECQLCPRLCSFADHFHGLEPGAIHLCGQEHPCLQQCELPGICQIETQASEIIERFSGKHETFQYTKYTQVARRLSCVRPIPADSLIHAGRHKHSTDKKPFHYCETRCKQCQYFCSLPLGHAQTVHETRHGSMSGTRWLVDSPDDSVELNGHKFGSDDDGAPMLCSMVCAQQGRHAHVDFCRATGPGQTCQEAELQHIRDVQIAPLPKRPKDWVSHQLFWARLGFKDPYSREEQQEFSKCDSMCGGPEHRATQTAAAQPSFCTLELFHPPQPLGNAVRNAQGYVSHDGHSFSCPNPALLHQAYHVIFVIDSSGSMTRADRAPIRDAPSSALIRRHADNRYGAVLSALYGFWTSRQVALQGSGVGARRDAYSVVTFSSSARTRLLNDFTSTPDQLLNALLNQEECGGTNFDAALRTSQQVMVDSWSSERSPVLIFLSDGESAVADATVYDICRRAVVLGKALSLHTVSFGQNAQSYSLRRMTDLAREVFSTAPRGPLGGAQADPCTYTDAIDTIQLAETFLGFADSLRKTRAALLRPT